MSELILIADDDANIRQVVRFAMQKAGFRTIEAEDGAQAIARFDADGPALILLDISMPEMNGTDVCRELRRRSEVPIVFLTASDDEIDRIIGLELGGDDYVTKPFSPRELVARVRAVLRRAQRVAGPPPTDAPPESRTRSCGSLRLDLDRFQAFWGDAMVVLTVTEFGLVKTLMGFPGKVYSRDELMDGAYTEHTVVSDRTIDSHIRRVRKKFTDAGAPEIVETVHGVGYKLSEALTG